jgi:RNA polymerase sigma factor (sigma-70 family)
MFRTTIWSELSEAAAGQSVAVGSFVSRYRPPLTAYFQRQGVGAQDAEDLAQEVFIRLFSHAALERADREVGRFRGYLLGVAKKVLLQHWRRAGALKRGGGVEHVSFELASHDLGQEAADSTFDQCWQDHLMHLALEQVRRDHARHYDLLARAGAGQSPAEIAASLGRTPSQIRVDLHRARQRLAQQVRAEIARTASSQEELDAELHSFQARLGPPRKRS